MAAGRDADRDRLRVDPDAQCLAGGGGAAVEFVDDLLVEPDPDLLPLGDLGERRLLCVPASELGGRPRPLDRVAGRHHSWLEAPVIGPRLRESLDAAEYLADIRGEHAGDLPRVEALAVHVD